MTATRSTPRCEREDRHDLVAVDDRAVFVDREHAVAVAVERDAEVELSGGDAVLQRGEVGRAAADVDVGAVGFVSDRLDVRTHLLERTRCNLGVRAVRAVDGDSQTGEVAAEALEHVLEITVDGDADMIDLAAAGCRRVEQRLDLLLRRVVQLASVAIEELDAVVLGRVVRRGDDHAEVEPEQGNRGRRHDACQHRGASCRCDTPRERLLELFARGPRVAADEDAASPGPERRRLSQLLEQLGRHELAHDAANSIGSEVAPRHAGL